MRKIRTLIVDDEPLARARIINLLSKNEGIQVLGECKNGREALKQIASYKPDLVFMDIQMPDINGFEVLSGGKMEHMPFIIFVTAYDQYALKAFDVKAVDYLMKPYDEDRFQQAVEHARQQILYKESALLHQKMINLLDEHRHNNGENIGVVELKEKGRTVLVKIEDLYYVEAEGNYLRLFESNTQHLLRETMVNFEAQIDKSQFLRIHRSVIVNTNFIERVSYRGNNQFQFTLKNDKKHISSRGYRDEIVKYLDEEELKKKLA